MLDRDPPDLVILDLNLPHVDGLTVLEELKRHLVHADLPVLVLSAAAPDEVVPRALGLGAGDFVPKPFSAPELIARVKAQLRTGRASPRRAPPRARARSWPTSSARSPPRSRPRRSIRCWSAGSPWASGSPVARSCSTT
ncbi:MAG: response regulator [Gemmatimonadales bacterium]